MSRQPSAFRLQLGACAIAAAALVGGGCADNRPSPTAGQINSIDVQLIDPGPDGLGSPDAPVDVRQATFNVIARDEQGNVVNRDVTANVFISFGGVKTGGDTGCGADVSGNDPIETLALKGGMLMGHTTQLPAAYGATSIWVEEPTSGAIGASPTIYFRNALIPELQTPVDVNATNATFCSPFNGKFVVVDHASPGGQLVVTSVYSGAFGVTDTGATGGFNSIYVYAFGKPPPYIVEGRVLKDFSGNYSKFVGFTELNFPLFDADMDAPLAPLPPPIALAYADISNEPKMLSAAASIVSYTGTICNPLPDNPNNDPNIQKTIDSWNKFNQFVVDNDTTCDAFTNLAVELEAKVVGTFDPLQHVGQKATFVGMLQNHSGQNPELDKNGNIVSCTAQLPCPKPTDACIMGECYKSAYNFWTILPRRDADVTFPQ